MTHENKRRQRAYDLREQAAAHYKALPTPAHISNGDDARYAGQNYFASFTKGLPHDAHGEVIAAEYEKLLHALQTGDPADFARVPQGWSDPAHRFPFVDPQAGIAFDLEGIDSHQLTIPPCYPFASAGALDEIAENYWLALCRDVPFAAYGTGGAGTPDDDGAGGSLTQKAATDLSTYAVFDGPMEAGHVTVGTLFRGNCPGDLLGPYVSQFLLLPVPYGSERFEQKLAFVLPDDDYMTKEADWLKVQKGFNPGIGPVAPPTAKFLYRGRDMAQYVHIDELFQAYLNTCLLLISPKNRHGMEAPLNLGNPYPGSNQTGFGTLGEPNFKVLVAEVATRALKAIWFQKWFVHRRQRPEVFAGRIHYHVTGKRSYPFHPAELLKIGFDPSVANATTVNPATHQPHGIVAGSLLDRVFRRNAMTNGSAGSGTYLLPMAFPEGSPLHPAYGAGHATVAGACVTVLKALFDDQQPILPLVQNAGQPGIVEPDGTGANLVLYGGSTNGMTVGSELDKLAANVGIARNFAGVHWRSDFTASLTLGEQVAMNFLRDTIQTYNEDVYFDFTAFDGRRVTITKEGVS